MFIGQYTIEQKQEQCWVGDYLANSSSSPLCAWCLSEQGIAADEGSHGICKKHADSFLKQWKELRTRRSMARTQEGACLCP